jgi:hypothetical protein
MLLDVTKVGVDVAVKLSFTRLFAGIESKFAPIRLTDPPTATICGLNEAICGIPVDAATVNELALVTEPWGVVTVIGPVVAPVGTFAIIWFIVLDMVDPATPLNCTELALVTELNPVPVTVTVVLEGPWVGVKEIIERSVEA